MEYYNEERMPENETEMTDDLQEEIRFFAEEPDEGEITAEADARAAEENADEIEACCFDDGDAVLSGEWDPAEAATLSFRERFDRLRENCRTLSERLADDMRATNNNPYIRSTTTYRYEILRDAEDTEPVDVFEFQRTSGASLRAMALTAAIAAAAEVAAARIFKKK